MSAGVDWLASSSYSGSMRNLILGLFTLLLWLSFAAILRTAHAQSLPDLAEGTDRELALALAQVTWNEASSYAAPEDLYLIAQVVENHGPTNADRLAWLQRHSSCVLGDREPTEREIAATNCSWSRELSWSTEMPPSWPSNVDWQRRSRRWVLVLQLASQIVQFWRFPRPCEGRPTTWGSVRLDMKQALERGLVPHRCSDTLGNVGFSTRG